MKHISYHSSHEQFLSRVLLRLVKKAEGVGFISCDSTGHSNTGI